MNEQQDARIIPLDEDKVHRGLKALTEATPPSPRQAEMRNTFLASVAEAQPNQTPRIPRVVRRLTFAAALTVAVMGVALLASPELRVLAQDIIDFFIPGAESRQSSVTVGGEPPAETDLYPLSVAQLQEQVAGTLYLPTEIPETYHYDGGRYESSQQTLTATYRCDAMNTIGLTVRPLNSDEITPYEVGASANIIDVDINGIAGQYVRGFWIPVVPDYDPNAPAPEERTALRAEMVWTNDSDHQMLWWYDADTGLSFVLSTLSGTVDGQGETTTCDLDMANFVNIARSVTPQN